MLMPMSLGLIVLVLVMAGNFVYWAINSIVNQGMSVAPVIKLFFLAAPGFAVQGIPAGVILGVCLVLNRAVRDNEILALRAGGASLPRIVMPFLVMALLASFGDWLIVEKIAPKTNDMASKSLARLMSQNVVPLIDNDRYFRAGQYYFYVGTAENGVLRQVMIYQRDASQYSAFAPATFPVVMIAAKAYENPQKKGEWVLENVITHTYSADGSFINSIRGATFRINVEQDLNTYFGEQKEDIRIYTGDDKRVESIRVAARSILDFSAAYYVYDSATNTKLGALRRRGLKSIVRDEWQILDATDREIGLIQEDSAALAILRRTVELISIFVPQKYTMTIGNEIVGTMAHVFNPFSSKIDVDFSADTSGLLDRRVAMAAGVLMCAIEGKQG